ncbi:hypothetical protein ACMA1I_18880 [Pontibacter sp. 13R65]|uniref:hypothetical protein n=1 Tax=Pontibacter sp. 13R65 TaxID=3127458 RepID=UPI00301E4894
MNFNSKSIFAYILRPLIAFLPVFLVQSAAVAQISHAPSAFQKEDGQLAAKQQKEIETIYLETHLDRGASRRKDETNRQKVIRTEKRKLRFNNKGKAVKRRQLKNSQGHSLIDKS